MNYLIVGLGNPGSEYKGTRHNIGWDIMNFIKPVKDLNFKEKFKGIWSSFETDEDKFYVLMPQTYMNLSGESVIPFANYFKVEAENILVIHDELDLPWGTIAFKDGGGLAGHNGLKSIAGQLGHNNFKRLRMGIGRPTHGDVSSWVLGRYHGAEADFIDDYLEKASKAVECYVKNGFKTAIQRYKKKKLLDLGDK
ncbi:MULTISPECIES: aminoacyl-tRNA hydrolase [Halobacteriovorax]|uniref:Peptidyl-tRNA hydrolase n=1 Tax=Halobacteriovorax vibrionivorans TaxID=2152716 RepID=A0ABY0IJ89_9BACT|nr:MULTISPECIES: aminoacyl-tRNA hydrolase [Halobacteriovorax]AYF45990.1 putative aminoacyl-tRNA hydrolase [Halobacteriovorax sp. BALOs_7]RZF23016.1 aminoacyl-tRNA hydrolase [Halobacteriovorax vibrionivorans]TGD48812.1 aminoacyl-tRNA hydrolase [Halobacteriovorax sp. Y22]